MQTNAQAMPRDTMLSRRASAESCPILTDDPAFPLQVWSTEAVPYREDVFRLEDGRIVSVSAAKTASAERLEYSVQILTGGYNRKHYGYDIKGHCGSMYWHPSGSWELFPRERMVNSWHRNRHGIPSGIHCDLAAPPRLAALHLIAASDKITREQIVYVEPTKGLKVGKQWRIIALGAKPEHINENRPAPNSLPVRNGCSQHFLATKVSGDCGRGGPESSLRIVVSSEPFYSDGLILRPVSCHTYFTWASLEAPKTLLNFCVSRCRHA